MRLLTLWQFDLFFAVLVVVLGGLYDGGSCGCAGAGTLAGGPHRRAGPSAW